MTPARTMAVCVLIAAFAVGVIRAQTPKPAPKTARAGAPSSPSADVYKSVYNGRQWWHVDCCRCLGVNAIATTLAPSLIDPAKRMPLPLFVSTVRNGRPVLG